MQIPIPIPRWLLRASDTFQHWVNVPVWQRGQRELRRIDVMIAYGFIACVGGYWMMAGWKGALVAGLTYVSGVMVALWF